MAKFFKEYQLHIVFGLGMLIMALSFTLAWYHLTAQGDFLILHFDSYRGIDLFGNIGMVYQILSIAGTVLLMNFLLASILFNREKFFSYMLAFGSLFFSILLLVGISVMIVVN